VSVYIFLSMKWNSDYIFIEVKLINHIRDDDSINSTNHTMIERVQIRCTA
jgi:hypothetical protein